ncbi:MAG TPA: Gldg family protein [Prolixibacteraceae bacterium]|nr:Gldg family protein [Prolixibacteraceae bacterium]
MKKRNSITLFVVLIIGIVFLVNIVSSRYFFRIDFTSDKRYTLSKATKNIVKGLDNPVTVTAYFTKDLPPAIMQTRNDFNDLLVEYSNLAKGKFAFEFVNPNDDDKVEQEISKYGIAPQIINVREKDQAVQKKIYLSALVKYGDKKEVIPIILPGTSMEYSLSSAIKKLTTTNKPTLGYITGHGEPSLQTMQQAMQALDVMYTIENINLSEIGNLKKYKSLILVSPADTLSDGELLVLDNYLAQGGNLYLALNRVTGNLNNATGDENYTGIETWLKNKGIIVDNQFIIDASCGSVSVRQQQGVFSITTQLSFPFLPLIKTFSDHPVSKGLETVLLQFASPIQYVGDTTMKYSPLAFSSEKSGLMSPPIVFDIQKKWGNTDFTSPKQVVAASFEGMLSGNEEAKMIVIGDGDFAINGQGQQARQLTPDNVNLMVNSIDWLSDDTGLIELRTKGVTNRPLDQIEDGKKTFLKYFNFLLPILLIIIYGLFRSRQNKIKEVKRMQEHFID